METIARSTAVPQASPSEVASMQAVLRAGWAMRHTAGPRPASASGLNLTASVAASVTASLVRAKARRSTAVAALRRLAADPAATSAERALAAHRAELLRDSA